MLVRALSALAAVLSLAFSSPAAWAQKDIRWGTGPVGSVGQKVLVVLANLLNKEMPQYRITVLPMPGAVMTVKGFATEQIDAYYGSDDALQEFAADTGRFKGFKEGVKRTPVQSMWLFTIDCGIGIKAANRDKFKKWGDLTGHKVYTGPLPFDTRLHLEKALAALGVKHNYTQVDLSTVGSQLDSGTIEGTIVYYGGGTVPAPWLSQASLAVDWAGLNPSAQELAELKAKGFAVRQVDSKILSRNDIHVAKLTLLPFYWGFDIGMNMPADDVYKMLTIVDKNADALAQQVPDLHQVAQGKLAEFQTEALAHTWNVVPIHPGLARFLKEKGAWQAKWDSQVAK
ncbi:MAG TPA: TAXI family TRAP transporter solute-binding subunit [Burkholderiales bacterium]|nr:TAXI family TRAP transporter solute-binding subunit [Burkholderiales bacterium]